MLKKILGILLLIIGLLSIAGVIYELYLLGLRKSHFSDKNYLKSQGLDRYLIKSIFGWIAIFVVAFVVTPIGIRLLSSKNINQKKVGFLDLKGTKLQSPTKVFKLINTQHILAKKR